MHTEIRNFLGKKTIGLTFFLGASMMAFAQEKQNITGKITDENGNAVPYASIEFNHKSNKALSDASLSDEKGDFTLNIANGDYDISIDAINFQKKTWIQNINGSLNLGNITLSPIPPKISNNEKEISEVTIVGRSRQAYKVELDKKVYQVDQDLNAKGGSLQDVLSNVPSVSVETDGSVSMRGNSNVKFLINGKPSSILGITDDSSNALKSIPADQIERIEIITNPSSKFEAEGTAGILNIILKKTTSMGFNGSVNGSVGYQPASRLNTNLAWNYGKWRWFANGGGGFAYPKNEFRSNIFYKNTRETLNMLTTNQQEHKNYNFNTGFSYDFTEKSSFNAAFTVNNMFGEPNSHQSNISSLTRNTFRSSKGNDENKNIQVDAGFEHKFNSKGHLLSLSGSFQNTENNSNATIEDNRNSTQTLYEYLNVSNSAQTTWLGKLDYELPIGEHSKLEAGARYDYKNNEITNRYAGLVGGSYINIDDVTGNNYYKEQNSAFYLQFRSKIGNFGYQLGLRNENINIDILSENSLSRNEKNKKYNEFFPSAFLSYDLTENSQLSLNYARRVKRPRSFESIPIMRIQNDPNRFIGNPDLNPSFVNSFELSYTYTRNKWNISPTLYYQKTSDDISFLTEEKTYFNPITGQNTEYILTTPYNIGKEDRYGLDFNYSINPINWLRLFGNVNIFRYKNETARNNLNIIREGNSAMARLTAAIKLGKTMNMQLQGHFRGGQKNFTTETKDSYALNFAVSKNIWNNTGSINFSIQDVFNSRKMRGYTDTDTFTREAIRQMMPRQFLLSFSYRFKSGTTSEPKPQKQKANPMEQEEGNQVAY